MGTLDFKKKGFQNFRYEKLRRKLRKVAKGANDITLTMQISNYLNEKENKAVSGRKWHNYAENIYIYILCLQIIKRHVQKGKRKMDNQKEEK